MIPFGYSGGLNKYEIPKLTIKSLAHQTLTIEFPPALQDIKDLLENFQKIAREGDITIKFKFTPFTKQEEESDSFAKLSIFGGNQRDALGNWSFLFSGRLKQFKQNADPYFKKIITSTSDQERGLLLKQLHKVVLDNIYAVPFMIETSRILTSNHVDVSKWNLFDMRMRFYDVRWM